MFTRPSLVLLMSLSSASLALADVRLPAVISDNMVLQKTAKAPIWGWASPGEKVTVQLGDQTASATADDKGAWRVALDTSRQPTTPAELIVTGNNVVTARNVLVGEVWLASGQSNMEFTVAQGKDAKDEIAAADFPQIRHFHAAYKTAAVPQAETTGRWEVCSPKTAGWFTAVGYYFARSLHQELKVPVGLVHTSWGGTDAEAWTSAEGLAYDPRFKTIIERNIASPEKTAAAMEKYRATLRAWEDKTYPKDPGNTGFDKGWAKAEFDDAAWKTMQCPTAWENAGLPDFDGTVWFRKTIDLPATLQGKDLILSLGAVDDFDTTYVNGTQVGATGNEVDEYWAFKRKYKVAASVLKPGKNLIAVRVFDHGGQGGLMGPPGEMNLGVGRDTVDLAGPWLYQVEKQIPTFTGGWAGRPQAPGISQNSPTALYNAMINPLVPYALAGAIWYQGENNAGRAYAYRTLFPAMITDWRSKWNQGDFPFYFVQLANFTKALPQPGDSEWAELREAQSMTLKLPNTGMAVIIDIGDAVDIHPKNKQDVGKRLALNALAKTYGHKIEYAGPMYESMKIEGAKIRLNFSHTTGGLSLVLPGVQAHALMTLKGFAICGEDHKFVWADATIDGNTVVVSSPAVPNPIAVRYAWANNPECNLYNGSGLPASPFRTDDFPGKTAPKSPATQEK